MSQWVLGTSFSCFWSFLTELVCDTLLRKISKVYASNVDNFFAVLDIESWVIWSSHSIEHVSMSLGYKFHLFVIIIDRVGMWQTVEENIESLCYQRRLCFRCTWHQKSSNLIELFDRACLNESSIQVSSVCDHFYQSWYLTNCWGKYGKSMLST